MGKPCSIWRIIMHKKFLPKNLSGIIQIRDLDVDGKTILK
jgi:hypothetical protein